MVIRKNGRVAIGNDPWSLFKEKGTGSEIRTQDYKLFVQTGILTEKCK